MREDFKITQWGTFRGRVFVMLYFPDWKKTMLVDGKELEHAVRVVNILSERE